MPSHFTSDDESDVPVQYKPRFSTRIDPLPPIQQIREHDGDVWMPEESGDDDGDKVWMPTENDDSDSEPIPRSGPTRNAATRNVIGPGRGIKETELSAAGPGPGPGIKDPDVVKPSGASVADKPTASRARKSTQSDGEPQPQAKTQDGASRETEFDSAIGRKSESSGARPAPIANSADSKPPAQQSAVEEVPEIDPDLSPRNFALEFFQRRLSVQESAANTPVSRKRVDSALGTDSQELVQNVVVDALDEPEPDTTSSSDSSSDGPAPPVPTRAKSQPSVPEDPTPVDASPAGSSLPNYEGQFKFSDLRQAETASASGGPGSPAVDVRMLVDELHVSASSSSESDAPLPPPRPSKKVPAPAQEESIDLAQSKWPGTMFAAADQAPGLLGAPPLGTPPKNAGSATPTSKHVPFNTSLDESRISTVDSPAVASGTPANGSPNEVAHAGSGSQSGLELSESSGEAVVGGDDTTKLASQVSASPPSNAAALETTLKASPLDLDLSEDEMGLQLSASGSRSHSRSYSRSQSRSYSRSQSRSYSRSHSHGRSYSQSGSYSGDSDSSSSSGVSSSSNSSDSGSSEEAVPTQNSDLFRAF